MVSNLQCSEPGCSSELGRGEIGPDEKSSQLYRNECKDIVILISFDHCATIYQSFKKTFFCLNYLGGQGVEIGLLAPGFFSSPLSSSCANPPGKQEATQFFC